MAEHQHRLNASALLGVGAAFDFHAGTVRHAPHLIQRLGFEWAFRVAAEPRRLWKRYLTCVPSFIVLVLAQLMGIKRFPVER